MNLQLSNWIQFLSKALWIQCLIPNCVYIASNNYCDFRTVSGFKRSNLGFPVSIPGFKMRRSNDSYNSSWQLNFFGGREGKVVWFFNTEKYFGGFFDYF